MRDFKSGKIKLIICSDVMSRGLDIDDVELVINYDVPSFIPTYIHRIGRTARAGREGTTITLARYEEVKRFKSILAKAENSRQITMKIDRKTEILPFLPKYKDALHQLEDLIAAEQGTQVGHNKTLRLANIDIHTQTKSDVDAILRELHRQAKDRIFPNLDKDDQNMDTEVNLT